MEILGSPPLATTKTLALSTPKDTQSLETACSPPAAVEAGDTKESPQISEEGRVEPELYEEEREELDREEGLREDLEEEEEQEQKEVEGERHAPSGIWGQVLLRCLKGCREARLGRASLWQAGTWTLSSRQLSLGLCSRALSPHVGVSPAGAWGHAGQGVLSPSHFCPLV